MSTYQLPDTEDLATFLTDLLGDTVEVDSCDPMEWNGPDAFSGAIFVHQDKRLGGGAIFDLPMLSHAGCALTMTPTQVSEKIIREGIAEEHVLEAFGEILNITAGILNDLDPNQHVVLKKVFPNRRDVDSSTKTFFCKPGSAGHYQVNIKGYGTGRLSILRPD